MPAHWATKQSSLLAAWSQGTRNLTVLGPLSGSWVSYEGLRGEAYRQGALSDRVRDRETVSTGELDTGIHDLISWCRCGGRTAGLGTRDCVTWTVSWQQGLSGSSHQSYLVLGVCFCQVRDAVPQAVCSIWDWGRREVGWSSSRKVSRHSWLRSPAMDCQMLASLCAWSLVFGLGPRCQADQVGTHSLEWVKLCLRQ